VIRVYSDGLSAGLLGRHGARGATFAGDPQAPPERAVSLTMPMRLASWNHAFGLHPIFDMNLPEGYVRERLRLAFAKATGQFDDYDLLAITGRSQVGRLRFSPAGVPLDEHVPFQSIAEVLRHRRGGDLLDHLLRTFAEHSGISGVQPKVLVRDAVDAFDAASARGTPPEAPADTRLSMSFRGATHIVKLWDPLEYPELAANEFFCLEAARRCGLEVPRFRLADNGAALVIDRFDLRPDGAWRGLEDFCVLNGRGTADKYRGSYETALVKRLRQFVPEADFFAEAERLFRLIVLNCAVRNGDAHLKNFALLYDAVEGPARLAPVYDIVTTTAYLPADGLALTLDGSTRWPSGRKLAAFGTIHCGLTPRRIAEVFEATADACAETLPALADHAAEHPNFAPVALAMRRAWSEGIAALGEKTTHPGPTPGGGVS
jgi:serine/threonine-protein kinase HipA